MSIYIKGMKMPKENDYTIAIVYGDGVVTEYHEDYWIRGADGEKQIGTATSVPEHGRLIDGDALGIRDEEKQAYEAYLREKSEFFIEEPLLEYLRGRSEGLIHASGLVRFAPTIIPADDKEETE